jgi:hypothetical protein
MAWAGATAVDILSGPRGRQLCWALIDPDRDAEAWTVAWLAFHRGNLADHLPELGAVVSMPAAPAVGATASELALLPALAMTTELATYWQEPDPSDLALEHEAVRAALLPIARAVSGAPGAAWWATPLAMDSQCRVEWVEFGWPGVDDEPRPLSGAAGKLAAWRTDTVDHERSAAKLPEDPAASYSGYWWSAPCLASLADTSRAVAGIGAVGLDLIEDSHGWAEAWCRPVTQVRDVTVYEITGPQSWAELVERYPLDVSKSRRHDWWRVSGWAGRWLVPDFTAVAADYDAIHLTVLGYLTTAGRALPAGNARTLLAGWAPDATYWLADVLEYSGPATHWSRVDFGPPEWERLYDHGP